jgi:hypothetical protein
VTFGLVMNEPAVENSVIQRLPMNGLQQEVYCPVRIGLNNWQLRKQSAAQNRQIIAMNRRDFEARLGPLGLALTVFQPFAHI